MKLILLIAWIAVQPFYLFSQGKLLTPEQYREDLNYFWTSLNDEYCYFNKKSTDWQKAKDLYYPLIREGFTRDRFVGLLEKMLYEIYDHHASLNTNTEYSRKLVPTGADIWASFINGKPVIQELRKGFGAESCGIKPGMEIVSVNEVEVNEAIRAFLPISSARVDNEAKSFALRLLLAGDHITPRKISVRVNGQVKDFFPDKNGFLTDHINYPSMIETKQFGRTGYIKINNCLYDNALIPVFDSVMQTMNQTTGLIIDLRETPSGGNTSVAKAILSWFVHQEKFYQKHEYYYDEKSTGIKRSWEEIVSPRPGKSYNYPLVILCDHWTGSIAEGITIGFDALKRPHTRIIGTPMAGLNGAVYSYELPNSHIRFSFPAERLYHINGLPREQYQPNLVIDLVKEQPAVSEDIFLEKALAWLSKVKPFPIKTALK